MTSSDCQVCIEPFNKLKRVKIECLNCGYLSCRDCVKRYLLGASLVLSCMNCNAVWNPEFVRTIMPKTFLNGEYKEYRSNMLLSLEESLLPETQVHVEHKKNKSNLFHEMQKLKLTLSGLKIKHSELKLNYQMYRQNKTKNVVEAENLRNAITKSTNEIYNVDCMYRKKYYEYTHLRDPLFYRQMNHNNYRQRQPIVEERRQFIMKCPDDTCRGFLSTQYKCGTCSRNFCKECHKLKLNEHICNEDDVNTIRLLKGTTKPCPNCCISIFKIDGCDQMWCTNCRTPFSWNTGRVIQGQTIHNPHFFEWQRNRGHDANHNVEQMCGNGGNNPRFFNFQFLNETQRQRVYLLVQVVEHTRWDTIPSLQETNQDRFQKNLDIRMEYLMDNISKDHFKRLIHRRDKASEKKRIMLILWQTFVAVFTDILYNLSIGKDFEKFEMENKEMLGHINSELKRISKLYSTQIQIFDEDWNLVNTNL